MDYTVSALTNYVKTNEDVLIKSVVLGDVKGDTIGNLTVQTGIKTKERLNYLNVEPSFQDGTNCGFSASGSTEFTDRELETKQYKAQDQYCDRVLLGKFAEYQVKINSQKEASDLPFEAELMDEIIGGINAGMEKEVWLGTGTGGSLIKGFVTLAADADKASTVAVSIESGTSVYNAIKKVVMAIPERIIDEAVVFVSPAIYRAFVQEMVEKNYFHYDANGKVEDADITFPGTDIKVHKTIGLTGDKKHIYASSYKNMVYGCDLQGDEEKVKVWYDDNSELFKYSIRWNAGVMTYFPDMVVLGTGAADLV